MQKSENEHESSYLTRAKAIPTHKGEFMEAKIVYEMGELGVLGPTIKGKDISVYTMQPIPTHNILKDHPFSSVTHFICKMGNGYLS